MKKRMRLCKKLKCKSLLLGLALCSLLLWGCSLEVPETSALPAAQTEKTTKGAAEDAATAETTEETLTTADLSSFSGEIYVVLCDNIPSFTEEELSVTDSYESYSELDALGRCGVAMACVGQDLMPTEERGSIGQIKPTGWHTIKYDCIDGLYLYNRCHLLAYELTGENANEKNLITGTRYFNVSGMLPFENQVADYVKETGNHVLYRVTPVFSGDNLVADGVEMEAYSLEDGGEGVSFHVFVFNIQPGIEIDYATGESWENDEITVTNALTEAEDDSADAVTYIVNTNTKKFHTESCESVSDMAEHNKQSFTGSRDALIELGYEACKRCNP